MKPGDHMTWTRLDRNESRTVRLVEPDMPGWWVVRGSDSRDYFAHVSELIRPSPQPGDGK